MNNNSDNSITFETERGHKGTRLDIFIHETLNDDSVSRSKVQAWIKQGLVTVDGKAAKKPNFRLDPGQHIVLTPEVAATSVEPEEGELDVLFEDEHIAVIAKPAGLTVHPAPGVEHGTLVNILLHRYPAIADMDEWRPGIVHRLDKDTSGVMVVALEEASRLKLSSDFAGREVQKVYLALVHGVPEEKEALIDSPMGRDPSSKVKMAVVPKGGRDARSRYRVLWSSEDEKYSLVAVRIYTGRTHQIRVHLASIGHPIIGDSTYGPAQQAILCRENPEIGELATRQMLHATFLRYEHPSTGAQMEFTLPVPEDFRQIAEALEPVGLRVGIVGMPGSGKSYFCKQLAQRGYPVFSADAVVAEEYEVGRDAWTLLRGRFGDRFIESDNSPVDKRALFEAMQQSFDLRREIEEIVHPLVQHQMQEFFATTGCNRIAIAEIPLLLEAGWKTGFAASNAVDVLVGIQVDHEKRMQWLADRGLSSEDIAMLDGWQWPQEQKLAACTFVVENQGTPEELTEQVDRIANTLEEVRSRRQSELRATMKQLLDGQDLPFTEEDSE